MKQPGDLQRRRARVARVNAKRPPEPPPPVRARLRVVDRRSLEALADALGALAADLWLDGLIDL